MVCPLTCPPIPPHGWVLAIVGLRFLVHISRLSDGRDAIGGDLGADGAGGDRCADQMRMPKLAGNIGANI